MKLQVDVPLATDIARHQDNEIILAKDQFIKYGYEVMCLSKWTMRTRETHLRQFVNYCTANDITEVYKLSNLMIDTYFAEYTQTHCKSTANTGKRIIKVFLHWVAQYKEMPVSARPELIRLVKVRDKTPKYLEVDVIRQVVKCSKNKQDSLMIALAFETGVRISELVNIRVSDIHSDALHVVGKGEIERYVYITDRLASFLRHHIAAYDLADDDYLLRNVCEGWSGQLSIKTARVRMQKCFQDIAHIHMFPHQLRHTLAINLLNTGCDIVTIQNILGHSDITTTQAYLRVSNTYVKTEYKKHIGKSII